MLFCSGFVLLSALVYFTGSQSLVIPVLVRVKWEWSPLAHLIEY